MGQLNPELIESLVRFALRPGDAPRRYHITRLAMYHQLGGRFAGRDSSDLRALSISKSHRLAQVVGLDKTEIVDASWPEDNWLELERIDDNSFDFLLSDQVLEHVAGDPARAMRETMRVLKPGGTAVVTTCAANPLHHMPHDYWRFTPSALQLLASDAGWEIEEVGAWGNRDVWDYIDIGDVRMQKIPEDPKNPLYQLATRNDRRNPIVTWVVGSAS